MIRDKLARFIWNAPSLSIPACACLYSITLPMLMEAIGYAQHKSMLYSIVEFPIASVLAILLLCVDMVVSAYCFKTVYALGRKVAGVVRRIG